MVLDLLNIIAKPKTQNMFPEKLLDTSTRFQKYKCTRNYRFSDQRDFSIIFPEFVFKLWILPTIAQEVSIRHEPNCEKSERNMTFDWLYDKNDPCSISDRSALCSRV